MVNTEQEDHNHLVASSMVVTRFAIPPARTHLLARAALIESLNQNCSCPLVLLSASAGAGKTTLLATWARQHSHPVAWLSLDSFDNDPLHFWSAVLLALRTRFPLLGEEALTRLLSSQSPNFILFVTMLLNEIAASGEEITLILDDYHLIEEPAIHSSLTYWLTHAPTCLHLVLSSRIDPPLALSRFRARGQLAELRDADLRLSEQEVPAFLQRVMGLRLDAEDERRLAERTEGWLVGLQLAALSLARHPNPSAWVRAFGGDQRLILDYLREELLSRQEASIRRFLLRVCILPRMNASLCQTVTGKATSQQLLDVLERRNLFVIPLDDHRQWYRFHDLFREALLAYAQTIQPELLPTLYERAALWYEQHGLLPEAIDASLQAGSFERAASLIERTVDPKSFRNAYHTLCRWFGQMPQEIIQAQPALSFLYALAIMFTSQRRAPASWERIEPLLRRAEQGFAANDQRERLGDALELHAELAFFQEDTPRMIEFARQATPLLSEHNLMYSTNFLSRGYEDFLAGDLEAAWQHFLAGQKFCQSGGNFTAMQAASLFLGEVCLARGELHKACDYFQQVLDLAYEDSEMVQHQLITGAGDRESFFLSWAYCNLARLSYEWNDLERAHQYLTQAQVFERDAAQGIHVLASKPLTRIHVLLRLQQWNQAQSLLEMWQRQARFPWVHQAIHAVQARLDLALGNLSAVEQWLRREPPFASFVQEHEKAHSYVYQEEGALLLIRLHLAQKNAREALLACVPWKEQARTRGRLHTLLEILLLEAQALFLADEFVQAQTTLIQALKLALPERYQRLFLDEGRSMASLLGSTLGQIQDPDLKAYAQRLLDAFDHTPASAPGRDSSVVLEPLTPQEQRVLRLLAEGLSNQQIADQLIISLATARKHVSNILGKLGAANRTQAIVRARECALL
jgi:LuxR family maltose regulon positive regulatory protein